DLQKSWKLAKVTNLKPVLDNATRWMSVAKMIERCKELIPYVTQSNRFSSTNDLQNESMNLDDVRTYFDLLIEEHPDLECRLGKNAPVIQDPSFEEAVVKVLRKQESVLASSEKQKLQSFIVEQNMQPIENEPITMKNRVAKKRKLEKSRYMDMNIIPPTSNANEHLNLNFTHDKFIEKKQLIANNCNYFTINWVSIIIV
ncbi:21261_t:CDS:2, partial [Gigaspora margarita]